MTKSAGIAGSIRDIVARAVNHVRGGLAGRAIEEAGRIGGAELKRKKPGLIARTGQKIWKAVPRGFRDKLSGAREWQLKNHLGFNNLMQGGFWGWQIGNDLANGESIGGSLGGAAGFIGADALANRLLPKVGDKAKFKALKGAGRFIAQMAAGIGGGAAMQSAANAVTPIGRLAKPIEETYGTTPEQTQMSKGAEENSMDKLAMLKEAEVAGVLAAFTDAGLMQKFASDDFDYLTEKVAENLPDNYTVDDVAYVTDALLSGGVEKTAEDAFVDETAPVLGLAYMAKLAGEMDDEEFDDFVAGYFEGAGF